MSAAQFYAIITLAEGIMLLLGWLYVTTGNPRSIPMLFKSVALFVLPGIILGVVPPSLVHFRYSIFIGTLVEELLKVAAARSEKTEGNRFFLIALFGIWELTWAKPLWGLGHTTSLAYYTNLQLAGLASTGLIPVLMHSVTAEIYAFRFQGRLWLAFVSSWAIHSVFDLAAGFFGVSLIAMSVLLLILALLLVALWPTDLMVSNFRNE